MIQTTVLAICLCSHASIALRLLTGDSSPRALLHRISLNPSDKASVNLLQKGFENNSTSVADLASLFSANPKLAQQVEKRFMVPTAMTLVPLVSAQAIAPIDVKTALSVYRKLRAAIKIDQSSKDHEYDPLGGLISHTTAAPLSAEVEECMHELHALPIATVLAECPSFDWDPLDYTKGLTSAGQAGNDNYENFFAGLELAEQCYDKKCEKMCKYQSCEHSCFWDESEMLAQSNNDFEKWAKMYTGTRQLTWYCMDKQIMMDYFEALPKHLKQDIQERIDAGLPAWAPHLR